MPLLFLFNIHAEDYRYSSEGFPRGIYADHDTFTRQICIRILLLWISKGIRYFNWRIQETFI